MAQKLSKTTAVLGCISVASVAVMATISYSYLYRRNENPLPIIFEKVVPYFIVPELVSYFLVTICNSLVQNETDDRIMALSG